MSCTICFLVQTVAVRFREGRMGNTYILAQVHQAIEQGPITKARERIGGLPETHRRDPGTSPSSFGFGLFRTRTGFSFSKNICEMLKLEPDYIRRVLLRLRSNNLPTPPMPRDFLTALRTEHGPFNRCHSLLFTYRGP